jgi:hypothetical protein
METMTDTAAAALARKFARKECNARFDALEKAEIEHRAALALTDGRVSWDDLRDFRARQKITGAAWLDARREWFSATAAYCSADADYCGAIFEQAKVNIRLSDNAETRKAYGKAIRARKAAVNREHKAISAARAAARAAA